MTWLSERRIESAISEALIEYQYLRIKTMRARASSFSRKALIAPLRRSPSSMEASPFGMHSKYSSIALSTSAPRFCALKYRYRSIAIFRVIRARKHLSFVGLAGGIAFHAPFHVSLRHSSVLARMKNIICDSVAVPAVFHLAFANGVLVALKI